MTSIVTRPKPATSTRKSSSKQITARLTASLSPSSKAVPASSSANAKAKKKRPKSSKSKANSIVCNLDHCMYPIVYQCVRERGWLVAKKGDHWDIGISDNNQTVKLLEKMRTHPRTLVPTQRINHFPDMRQIYNKAYLAKNVNALQDAMDGEITPFAPQSWSIPEELSKLTTHLGPSARRGSLVTNTGGGSAAASNAGTGARAAAPPAATAPAAPAHAPTSFKHAAGAGADDQAVYIVKPASGLQGHGIGLFTNPMESAAVQEGKKAVVQQYLGRPMLIDGFKFDLRLYVLVSSVEPLKIHLFNDGLARLCTKKYTVPDSTNLKKRQAHLTNFAINKGSKDFVKGAQGSKRSVKAVFQLLRDRGIDTDRVWSDVVDCINHTMLSVHPKLQRAYRDLIPPKSTLKTPMSSCFEILGFDVMLDSTGGVWLIEVNHAPSFKGGSKVDSRVKHGAVSGAFEILKLSTKRKRLLSLRVRKKWEKYMHAQALNPAPRGGSGGSSGGGGSGGGADSSSEPRPMTARQRSQAEVGGWRGSTPPSPSASTTPPSASTLPSTSSSRPSNSRRSSSSSSSSSISGFSSSNPASAKRSSTTAAKLATAGNVEDMMVQMTLGLGDDDDDAELGIYNDDGGDDIEEDSDDCADLGSDSDESDAAAIAFRNTMSPIVRVLPSSTPGQASTSTSAPGKSGASSAGPAKGSSTSSSSSAGSKRFQTRKPRKPNPARFKAPTLTDADMYVQIYSGNSASDRASYANVIEAAERLCTPVPPSTDA